MNAITKVPTLVVEQVPVEELRADSGNPRRITDEELDSLTRSIRHHGLVQPILARQEDSVVIGGHQRLLAARRLGMESVPVIWLDITTEEARLLNLALNRISGDWDEQLLGRLLAELKEDIDIDLSLSGFADDEISAYLKKLEASEKADQVEVFELESALEEARKEPRTEPGDLWLLGDHRLACDNATDPEAVAKLLDGAEPKLLVTDPPYGVSLDPTWRDEVSGEKPGKRTKGHRNTTLSGDTRVDWSEAYALVPSLDVGYVWHAGVHAGEVAAGLTSIGFEIVSQVIWDKGLFAMGRSWYHWGHEPCWVVRRKGAKARFLGSRDQSTIWRVPSPKMIMAGSKEPKQDHPAQKPALLAEIPIRNHTQPGEAVYDPFLGSGTTLIAADRHARVCYGMEIDPRYCDVILARWEAFTGLTAEKAP